MKSVRSILPAALLVAFAGTASAHPGHAETTVAGLAHPFMGMDHLLAMVAVGLWAAQLGGRARWALPLSFVAAMAVGGAVATSGVVLPQIEPMVIGSALALGALVAFATRLPLGVSAAIVAMSAFFHGQAHGVEMPAQAFTAALVSTTVLHIAGVAAGVMMQKSAAHRLLRACGAAIAVAAATLAW